MIAMKVKKNKDLIIAFVFKPKEYMLIISLSLCNFKNDKIKPNIITIGNIIVTKLGIKNIDRYNIVKISTCIKLDNDTNLVNCNNQDIDKNIKRMNEQPLEISKKIYLSILFIINFNQIYFINIDVSIN